MATANLIIEVPPAIEPISLALAKNHCRVTLATDDELFGVFIAAARDLVENYTGRSFVNKGFRQEHDAFPYQVNSAQHLRNQRRNLSNSQWDYSQMIKLQRAPLVSVRYIKYTKTDGTIGTLYPALNAWQGETVYSVGSVVKDPNGNAQICTTATPPTSDNPMVAASSGSDEPAWATSNVTGAHSNGTADDEDLVWTYQGPAPSGDFVVDLGDEPPRLFPNPGQFWPPVLTVSRAVRIHFTAGYGNAALAMFPAPAKLAMLMCVGNWNENRETVTPDDMKVIPNHFEDLLYTIKIEDYDPTPG